MLLQSFRLIWLLALFEVAFCNSVGAPAVLESRDKRSLDFGVFLKNLLQQSADLSSNAKTTRAPMAKRTTTTTPVPMTTTTAAPPPTLPQAFLQKTFYKTIPGLGRVGFGFGVTGNLANQPFFYPIGPQGGGYIDFDYNDGIGIPSTPTMASTSAPKTTTTTTTTTMPATPMMSTQPIPATPQPAGTRRKPHPILRILPPNAQQPGTRIVYQYIPTPHFKTQTPNPQEQVQAQENYASLPIDYETQDPYSGPQQNPQSNYDYPTTFYNARPAAQRGPTPTKSPRPIIIAPNIALNGRSQLSDNLIYQFAPSDDIYSRADARDASDGSDVPDTGVETPNNTEVASDDYNDDGSNYESTSAITISPNAIPTNHDGNYASATIRPADQQNYANIDYVDSNAPHDVSGPFAFQLNAHNYDLPNENPSSKNSAQKQGLFVYKNSPQNDPSYSHSAHPVAGHSASSYASMRFRTPFADFHTSTVNNGHHNDKIGQRVQHFPIRSKYY